MNAPLLLTSLRILAIPVVVIILMVDFDGQEIAAFAVFLTATLTDMLDGLWARKSKKVTLLGQLLDPTADKLLISSVLICLVGRGDVSAWMAVIIIGREIAVSGFRAIASSRGIHIPASPVGKIKMILETVTICLLLLGEKYLGSLSRLSRPALWLTVIAALISAGEYYLKFGRAVISGRS